MRAPLYSLLLIGFSLVPALSQPQKSGKPDVSKPKNDARSFVREHQEQVKQAQEVIKENPGLRDNPKALTGEVLKIFNDNEAAKKFIDIFFRGLYGHNKDREGRADRTQDQGFSAFSNGDRSERGDRRGSRRDPDLRESALREYVQQYPKDHEAVVAVADSAYGRQDYRAAYDYYAKAYVQNPKDLQSVLGVADAAYHLGDSSLASEGARRGLEIDPQNQRALSLLHATEDHAPTIKLPQVFGAFGEGKSPVAAPTGPVVSGRYATHEPSSDRYARPAVVADAARSNQLTKEASSAMRVRDYSGAYELASQAIALNPQNAQALNFRAIALTQLRRFDDAVKDASAALELAPGSAAALQTRSWAFAREGKYQESLKDARETLSRDPNNAFAYANQAFALAGLQDRVGVLDSLRRAAALDSRFAEKLERATQLPQDADLTLLFEDSPAASHAINVASPQVRMRRFARLTVFSLSGGLLMAIGILHIVSARWREKVKMTVRRVLSPMTVKPMPESSSKGAFWSQYSIIREIGVGGMGIVYEAKDRSLERHVAVKKMRDEIRVDVQDRKRFIAEARMVAQLHHPNIVDIYAILEDGADLFLVFELVEGRTLDTALKSDGPFDWKKTKQVIQEIAAAVTHAHARGIIHRDLKPANVMLTRDGRVKVMDFGIARQVNDLLTRHSRTITVAGTPAYMAPEQEQGIAGNEVDVYAMGVCLYEMATGQLPFAGIGAGMLMNKIKGKVSPLGERAKRFPIGFDAVCARALEPDLAKRYHTPAELIAALDALDLPTSIS